MINSRDSTAAYLVAALVVAGFFAVLAMLLFGSAKPTIDAAGFMVTVVACAFLAVVFFWFGSSVGSRAKDDILSGAVQQPTAPPSSPGGAGKANPALAVPSVQMPPAPPGVPPAAGMASHTLTGAMSTFGGADDTGVSPSEGLALCEPGEVGKFPGLFLTAQPAGTTGLARRLDPKSHYIACRWDYSETPRAYLQGISVTVTNPKNGKSLAARPIDWGPNERTTRIADLSPGLAADLGLATNDICKVALPLPLRGSVPVATVSSVEPPWLVAARAEIGFHEVGDNRGIQKYADLAGYGVDGEPWCSIFAGAMLRKAGIPIIGANAMAQSWTAAPCVTKIDLPQAGDLAVFERGARGSGLGHVGFYIGDAGGGRIQVLGGNEDDQVEIATYATAASNFRLLGYYRPVGDQPKVM